MSKLARISVLLAVFFALDKGVALFRQVIIARQFGLSAALDAFNVANNLPDLLFALISGGALAVAFIPVLSEVLMKEGQPATWRLFSSIANMAFLVTAFLAIVVAILADSLVGWEIGIAPGFDSEQKMLVISLMRLNLIATIIFSLSGLVMAGLQANQHFLLPAIAPLLYNLGQIFGALVLSPEKGIHLFGGVSLPGFGMGIYGLVYGVIIGALLHLAIQIPALIRYQFHWTLGIDFHSPFVQKVLVLMGPRLGTVFAIQLLFILRDNLASRLEVGAVTALTYGWMIMQVPETLIGTAMGTALLPTLSEKAAQDNKVEYFSIIERAVQVLVAIALPLTVILSFGLEPLLKLVFHFGDEGTQMLLWVTRGYLIGLTGQCLLEMSSRAFYAIQKPLFPLLAAGINLLIYLALGFSIYRILGAPGISLTDSVAFSVQAIFLLIILTRKMKSSLKIRGTIIRSLGASLIAWMVLSLTAWLVIPSIAQAGLVVASLVAVASMALALGCALPLIWREVRLLFRL